MNIIYWGDPERKNQLFSELARITVILQNDPAVKKVLLFGSLAEGRVGMKSDLDLLIIQDTDKPFLLRSVELMESLSPEIAVDLLVYTPKEFRDMQKKPSPFLREILKNGRIVYEKRSG